MAYRKPDEAARATAARALVRQLQMSNPHEAVWRLILQYGVGRFGAHLPCGLRKRSYGYCFAHAYDLTIRDCSRFIYCEGYGLSVDDSFLSPNGWHAWVIDKDDGWRVIDNTWKAPVQCVYLGIPLAERYVSNIFCDRRFYGPVLGDWENGYPILSADPATFLHKDADHIPRDFAAGIL